MGRWIAGLIGLLALGVAELAMLFVVSDPWVAPIFGCLVGAGLGLGLALRGGPASTRSRVLAGLGGAAAGLLVYLALWSIFRTCGSC